MSLAGIGLIAFVVLLSGFLSYYGDVLGRKLGKKRLTIGRLRPRHTAAMMTGLFGSLGSLVAILLLVFLSQPVRVMLLEGDRLKDEIATLKKDLIKRQEVLDQTKKDYLSTKDEVVVEKNKVLQEKAKLLLAQKDVNGLKLLTGQLKSQAQTIRRDLAKVKIQLAVLKPQYEKLKTEYNAIDVNRRTLIKFNTEISQQNFELDQKLQKSDKQLQSNKKQIEELNGTIKELQSKLFEQSSAANKQLQELQTQVDEAKSLVDGAKRDLETTSAEYSRLKLKLDQLVSRPETVSRTQPLIFSRGDELARIPARSKLNSAEAKSYLLALLQNASSLATSKGAKSALAGGDPAVLAAIFDARGNELSEDEKLSNLMTKFAGKSDEQVAIAYSFLNSFQGEPVPVLVQIRPNPMVYRQGQFIIETKVDGQWPPDQIVTAISKFVQEKLGPKVIADGLIPAIGRNEPLGEIGSDALLTLVSDVKSVNRTIRVQFIAAQDTRASDRLKLKFLLK